MFKFAAVAISAFALASAAQAASPRDQLLVSTEWLAANAKDPNLVILHIGDKAEYEAKHIPGARFVAGDALSVTGPEPAKLILEMPAPQDLEKRLEALGVSDNSRVVISYGKDRLPAATRVMFTFDAAGLGDRVSLLDGGLPAWEAKGLPLTSAAPEAKTGALSALKMQPRIVGAGFVQQQFGKPEMAVVDARASVFYEGKQAGGSPAQPQPRGHIPGAKSVPFSSITAADGTLKSTEELKALFQAAGVAPGQKVVAYCHVGQQGTAVVFAARLLGVEAVLYDGSFQEWSLLGLPAQALASDGGN